jgi:peptidoglycan-associated lipoprotein
MGSKFYSVLTMAALAITMGAACAHKPTTAGGDGANAGGENAQVGKAPAVIEKPLETDVQGSDSGKIAGLSTVFFEYDKASLTEETRKKLAANADWIKGHPNFTIQVEGHTDSRGSVEYNLALGERRAKSVKAYLQTLGIEAKRVTIISYGKEKPLDPGDGEAAWAKNRRANFVPLQ